MFVHASAVENAGMPPLTEGQKLNFEIKTDQRSGKPAASDLENA